MINLLELQPVKASTDLSSYASFIYGIPKIGKTTFVHRLYGDDVLFIATEKRHKVLTGAYVQYISTWGEYLTVIAGLQNPKIKEKFKVVAIDTVENLYEMLEASILSKYKKKEFGKVEWGKDWTDLKKEWKKGLQLIEKSGYTPCFISHATQITAKIPVTGILQSDVDESIMTKTKDKKTEEEYYEYARFQPDLKDKVMAPINKMVDNILFMTNTIDNHGTEHRVIHLRDTLQWQAGSTFEGIQPVIELSAESYKKAVTDSLNLIDPKMTKKEREEVGVAAPEYDFEALMKEARQLGVKFHKAGYISTVNSIAAEIFGEDQQITKAEPEQAELLFLAVERMKKAYQAVEEKLNKES